MKPSFQMLTLAVAILGSSFMGGSNLVEEFLVDVPAVRHLLEPARAIDPFLYAPYPGVAEQGSIFDHSNPNYTQTDQRIVAYSGELAYKNCPLPEPPGTTPPGQSCDAGYGGYWSFGLGDWVYYDGHDGIDYGISYRPVYAAADANQVLYAGWWDPQNHRANLGLYARLGHANGYTTTYGHLSAVAVQSCDTPGCASLSQGEMIGISGNTGNSIGPHLHFRVTDPSGRPVDPYGWLGSEPDPWIYNQPESLWVSYPALVYPRIALLPSGPALEYPVRATPGILVDDTSSRFREVPVSCWMPLTVVPGFAINNSMRFSRAHSDAPDCAGQWIFPPGTEPGKYAVFIHIPSSHATSEGAVYSVFHAGEEARLVIDQIVFPNRYYAADGWVYAGSYEFTGEGEEYVELTNRTMDEPEVIVDLEVGADAVRFVPASELVPEVAPTSTAVLESSATPTPVPLTSQSPTSTVTETITPTPLPTLTPEYVLVNVYFVDQYRLDRNLKPVERAGIRWAKSDRLARTVLDEYFRGPGNTERSQFGWIAIYNGFTGYRKLEIIDGVASLYLKGACEPGGAYTIADALKINLKQFDEIRYLKIYDQNGDTRFPEGMSDSIPVCLEP